MSDQQLFGRRDSDDHLYVQFTPDAWRARGVEVPASLPTNTNALKTATYNGRYVGRLDVTGAEGNDRRVILFPELTGFDMEVRTRFRSRTPFGTGQTGLVARGMAKPDGYFHGFVGWENIVFGGFWHKLVGYWKGFPSPTPMVNDQTDKDMRVLLPALASTGGFRATNVSSVNVPNGHGIQNGNLISVSGLGSLNIDLVAAQNVQATTVDYPQVAANDVVAGPGIVRNHSQTDMPYDMALRVQGNVATLKTWKSTDPEPGWDNTAYVATYTDAAKASNYAQGCPGLVMAHFTTGGSAEYEFLEAWRL